MGPAADRVRARVERICAAAPDARVLRLDVLAALRAAVPFDAYAWVLTDPATEVGSAPLADVPCLPELPRLIRLRYLTAVNRWTTLTTTPVARLAAVTGGDLPRSLLWRELLCRYDVSDVASVAFRDRFGCWAFLELWRTAGARFDDADARVLQEVAGSATAALRRASARTVAPVRQRLGGPLVLELSPDLEVLRQTPGTDEALRALVPRDEPFPPVPAGAYNVAAQLLATEAGVDDHPARARVHLAGGLWVTLRAARWAGAGPDADIAVTIEESVPHERIALLAAACGLSDRESELLGHLAAGADTRETAAAMFVSAHTVQDHLKSVFAKTGTRTRRGLLARATGGRPAVS